MEEKYIDILQSFVDLARPKLNDQRFENLKDDVEATQEALKYIRNTEDAKKTMLRCGYYDDDNGKDYIVEIDKNKLTEALKKLYNANEIIIK